MSSIYENEERRAFRNMIAKFRDKELAPFANDWEEAEGFPADLYQKAAALGLYGFGIDEQYGGAGTDCPFLRSIMGEELGYLGAGGVVASLWVRSIMLQPLQDLAHPDIRAEALPPLDGWKQMWLAGDHRAQRRLRCRRNAHSRGSGWH